MIRWWFFGWQAVVVVVSIVYITTPATSQPQTNLVLRSCSLLTQGLSLAILTNLHSPRRIASIFGVLIILMVRPVTPQKIDRNNTMIRWYCSFFKVMNGEFFLRNLNTTLSSLRNQLSTVNKYHAVAKTLINGESVYGLALCREYLSTAACLACFDTAVAYMKVCGLGNGAHIFYDDCELRYENSNSFYSEAIIKTSVGICGNTTSSHPKELVKTAKRLFSDLEIATPETPNFFAASTRRISGSNGSLYAIAQCSQNLTRGVCFECLKIRHKTLDSCIPNTFGRAIDSGCFMRYSETPFFGVNQTTDITRFLKKGDSRNVRSIIGGVIGSIGFLLFILAFVFWHRRSRNSNRDIDGNSKGATEMLQMSTNYTYKELKTATNNFYNRNIIGGSGNVYKGVLKDGKSVAIKKTLMASKRGKAYLEGELKIISNVHHRYLTRLLGYCRKGPHLYLVHEYMENGSLDTFIYGEKCSRLNWNQRFDIIFGVARGLAYLHEQYHVTIIHTDIKSSNILLDNEFQPKIADFGLVKLFPEDKTHLSRKVTATLSNGYIAPEYAINGHLSEKVDTYSFGILVLEVVSGKWCNEMTENGSISRNLVENARSMYEKDMHFSLIDATLDPSEYVAKDAKRMIEIGLMCTQSTPSARPAMSEVVTLLSGLSLEERRPMRSTVKDRGVTIQVDISETHPSNESVATYGSPSH